MIKSHEKILLHELPLFTKVSLETPINKPIELPSEACYVYIFNGDGQALSNSEDVIAKSGQVILSLCGLTAGKMIADQPKGKLDTIIVHFGHKILKKVFQDAKPKFWKEIETPVTQYVVQSAANNLVKNFFAGISPLFDNKAAITESLLILKLKEIIFLLLQTDNAENIRHIVKSLFSEKTFTFKELVDAHIKTTESIESLAMITNCSISTFKRNFKKAYSTSPRSYIINRNVEKVADLLKTTDDSISAIGYACGFNSPEHLSRTFKKKFGLSPKNFRLTHSIK